MKNKFNANLVNLWILQGIAAAWFLVPILINIAFIKLPNRTIIFNYISIGIGCFFQLFFFILLLVSIKKGMRLKSFCQDFNSNYNDLFIEKFRHVTAYLFNKDIVSGFCYKQLFNLKKLKYKQVEYFDSKYIEQWKQKRLKYLSIYIFIFNWFKCWFIATYIVPFFLYLPIILMLGNPRPNELWILVLSMPGIAMFIESFVESFVYKMQVEFVVLFNNPHTSVYKFVAYMNRYSYDYNRVIFSRKNRLRYVFIHRFTFIWEYFKTETLVCYDKDDASAWPLHIQNIQQSIESESDQEVIDRAYQKIQEYRESKVNKN
ncbi:hypothetical protein GE118_02410 [Mycoplasma sp. NEAQ87857]|uniref:hypothetical protein n=1 Tax=Mycoplasma sp. NEAQ87857 TaxID=2683967 RepID=UPI0013174928|nr:hypothetical protein [Mycoplasma sp. NEAQ87857]QGZ97647.1 hypothetical protein GE118_02410 [Mycoplasma sp. NEAQ87857]